MFPFGMKRFYGGLKLAFTKGGIPVPFEWTVGKTVEECVREMCEKMSRRPSVSTDPVGGNP